VAASRRSSERDGRPAAGPFRTTSCASAAWRHFRGDRLIVDNWHLNRPAKYDAVPNIAAVRFPIRRDPIGVAF
jgi:hypothetical protein